MITDPKPQIPQSRSSTPEPINSTLKIPMVTTSKHPLFYINRGGFPLNNENQQKMFNFCLDRTKDLNLEFHNQVLEISEKNLGQFKKISLPSRPPVWLGGSTTTIENWDDSFILSQSLGNLRSKDLFRADAAGLPPNYQIDPSDIAIFTHKVQKYMKSLKYNFTGMQFYDINKARSLKYLLEIAQNMIKLSLPIKCLEAVVLGIHLTNQCPNQLVRFTLSFKSVCKKSKIKSVHYHVLLGLYNKKLGYGCIGMSRKDELAYKKLGKFPTLENLILDIKSSYEKLGHTLDRVCFGLPITHNACSLESLDWSSLVIELNKDTSLEELGSKAEKFSRLMRITVKDH